MWATPNRIPGKAITKIHLPVDKKCPHCGNTYCVLEQTPEEKKKKIVPTCPICKEEISPKTSK